jgi:hypothetical protein
MGCRPLSQMVVSAQQPGQLACDVSIPKASDYISDHDGRVVLGMFVCLDGDLGHARVVQRVVFVCLDTSGAWCRNL